MKLDSIESQKVLFKLPIIVVITCFIFNSLHETYLPEKLPPMINDFQKLNSLKPVGIIGSYWNSYVFAAIDPEHIKATPYDKDMFRNRELANEVLNQPKLLLVQNEWLIDFPDSIPQFGKMLVRKGNPFLLGTYITWQEINDVMACEYYKVL